MKTCSDRKVFVCTDTLLYDKPHLALESSCVCNYECVFTYNSEGNVDLKQSILYYVHTYYVYYRIRFRVGSNQLESRTLL